MSVAQSAIAGLGGGAKSEANSSSGNNVITFGSDPKQAQYTTWIIVGAVALLALKLLKRKSS